MRPLNRRSFLVAALALLLTAPLSGDGKHDAGEQGRRKLGRAVLTFYWIVDESSSQYERNRTAEMLDVKGKVIARTNARFRRAVVMEGTGWLRDGRTIRYVKRVNGTHRFRIIRSRYGITANGCSLEPYRTVAVDPKFVRLGSRIYVPQLKGTILPDGTQHDGMFIANDRGAFRGAHIDVFVGVGSTSTRPFIRKGYRSRSRVTVYVEESRARGCR